MMKKVLFVAYNFPPAGGVGVQRSLKFVKYLHQFGWQPIVLTTEARDYARIDESTWRDVANSTPIYRVASYSLDAYRRTFERLHLLPLHTALKVAFKLPDAALFWPWAVRRQVAEIVKEYQPDLVYTSSGPLSAHFIGQQVQRQYGIPWLADYRDRWWVDEYPPEPALPGYAALNQRMQRRLLRAAQRTITVSEPLAKTFIERSGDPTLSIGVIENGYDESEVERLPPATTERFTISYTGTLNRKRPPASFVQAIDTLTSSGKIPVEQIRILFAGKGFDKFIPKRPPFEDVGFLDRDALNRLRRDSDMLLLLRHASAHNAGLYSGKVFEYLGSNRPVFVIAHPNNVAGQLVARAQAGVVVPHNAEQVEAALLACFQRWQAGEATHSPDWSLIHQFTRRHLTKRLAHEFEALAGGVGQSILERE